MFVYEPTILLQGDILRIIFVLTQATVGVVILAASLHGYLFGALTRWQQLLLFASAICFIYPDWRVTAAGLTGLAVVMAAQMLLGIRGPSPEKAAAVENGAPPKTKRATGNVDPLPSTSAE